MHKTVRCKIAWLAALVLFACSFAIPSAYAQEEIKGQGPVTPLSSACGRYVNGGSHIRNFQTPDRLPDSTNVYPASNWFKVEITNFTTGSPGVYVRLYYANGTLYDVVTLTSSKTTILWTTEGWFGCMYVKLISAGWSWDPPASGTVWVTY